MARGAATERHETERRRLSWRRRPGRRMSCSFFFGAASPIEKLTWVFLRHRRLLLLREARTAKSVIYGTPHLVTDQQRTKGVDQMEVVYEYCCGLDIHKKTVVACLV